jgi:uncharacterized membrane protein
VEVLTMPHQEATTVIAQPLDVVQERLREVESWPQFLIGLLLATRTGHERYRLVVRSGRTKREVTAAVQLNATEHRFTWKALEGPRYEGEIRLSAVDDGHTRVRIAFTSDPVGFTDGIREMFGSSNDMAAVDLVRLEDRMGTPDD